MDLLARFRGLVRIRVAPEAVTFEFGQSSFSWRSTVCLDPQSTKLYDVGKDACAEPDGVFVHLFDRAAGRVDEPLRAIGFQRFFIYGAMVAREDALVNPYAEVSGLASFDRRERDGIRAAIGRALQGRQARLRGVRFLD